MSICNDIQPFDFGEHLRKLRKEHNLTQKQVAERVGKSEGSISKYENNTQDPPPEILVALAYLYRTSVDYMLGVNKRKPIYLDDLPESKQKMILDIIETVRAEHNGK